MSNIVSLDGVSLESVSSCIRVYDVIELQPRRTTTTHERLAVPGSVVTRDHLNAREVRIQFAILTASDEERTRILSDVTAWAMQGHYLQLRDRPGQRLKVICTDMPVTMSKRKWTELCEMTFTAFSQPFWEDENAAETTCVNFANATNTWTVYPRNGNVRTTPLCMSIVAPDDFLSELKISVNGAEMSFTGLEVPAGNPLTISYPDGVLAVRYVNAYGKEVHCLANRTGAEVLPVHTHTVNEVTCWADVLINITFQTRGWYW